MNQIYDRDWQKIRARHLRLRPICEVVGCGKPARHVDHIVTVRADPSRRLDPSNLESLCASCHSRLTSAYDRGRLDGACDQDGNPLDPGHPWSQPDNARAIKVANARRPAEPDAAARLKRWFVNGHLRS